MKKIILALVLMLNMVTSTAMYKKYSQTKMNTPLSDEQVKLFNLPQNTDAIQTPTNEPESPWTVGSPVSPRDLESYTAKKRLEATDGLPLKIPTMGLCILPEAYKTYDATTTQDEEMLSQAYDEVFGKNQKLQNAIVQNRINESKKNSLSNNVKNIQIHQNTVNNVLMNYFLLGFFFNLISDTTFKQKALGNGIGISMSLILNYKQQHSQELKTPAHLKAVGYLCGVVTGSLTRAALNKTVIPLTAYMFKAGMKLLKK